jgi:hypothetical protein
MKILNKIIKNCSTNNHNVRYFFCRQTWSLFITLTSDKINDSNNNYHLQNFYNYSKNEVYVDIHVYNEDTSSYYLFETNCLHQLAYCKLQKTIDKKTDIFSIAIETSYTTKKEIIPYITIKA